MLPRHKYFAADVAMFCFVKLTFAILYCNYIVFVVACGPKTHMAAYNQHVVVFGHNKLLWSLALKKLILQCKHLVSK